MYGISEAALDELKERLDIVDVISRYVSLKRSGKNYVGLCPFHVEKTPSFTVSGEKQLFYCFGCNVGGNVFTFIMKKEGLDFLEAARLLADMAGIELRYTRPDRHSKRGEVIKVLEEACNYFVRNFWDKNIGSKARDYARKRGLSREVLESFQIGYSTPGWDDCLSHLRAKGAALDVIEMSGIVVKRQGSNGYCDRFRDRLMFPIYDVGGKIIAFGGRSLTDALPKYLNSPETLVFAKRRTWFGLNRALEAIRQTGVAIVVEGYLDAVTAHEAGFKNTVASLGTSLSREQASILTRIAKTVIIAYDSDAAGQAATWRGLEIFRQLGAKLKVARLPKGHDPDSFLRLEGPDSFQKCIDEALPLLDFLFERMAEGQDLSHPEGKSSVVKSLLPVLAELGDKVERAAYVQRWARVLEVPEAAFWAEIEKYEGELELQRHRNWKKRNNNLEKFTRSVVLSKRTHLERQLLKLLLSKGESFQSVIQSVGLDSFKDDIHREIAATLFQIIDAGQPVDSSFLSLLSPAAASVASELMLMSADWVNPEAVYHKLLWEIKREDLKAQAKSILREIHSKEAQGEPVPLKLLTEYQEVVRAQKMGKERGETGARANERS